MTTTDLAVRKSVIVNAPIAKAFAVFTERFDTWWPRTHKIGAADLERAVLEPREGGRWYEIGTDGSECEWGRVLRWDPPKRIVLAWQIGATWHFDPELLTEVEVRFVSEGPGQTRVDLEHRNLDRFEDAQDQVRATFDSPGGWQALLDAFVRAAAGWSQGSGTRSVLQNAARDLHLQFRGVFSHETIERLLFDSYEELAVHATVTRWLVLGAERFARQRLKALAHADATLHTVPGVLFVCIRNAGRSQMALGWFGELAGDKAVAWSGGSNPGERLNPAVVAAMAEVGIDIAPEFPKRWADEFIRAADVVVTMGCGDACPLLAGKHYEDWELEDPAGKTLAEIRPIRDEIGKRVRDLLARLTLLPA